MINHIKIFGNRLAHTLKGIVKIMLLSRPTGIKPEPRGAERLLVLGNGPSLRTALAERLDVLSRGPAMAVNFFANTPEFCIVKPRYYILADPHFFAKGDANVDALWSAMARVDWPMTLLVPVRMAKSVPVSNSRIQISGYNAVGAEGFGWFERLAYGAQLAMPRPRNVLIPAIMAGLALGYRNIALLGADHSWMSTIRVDADNRVVSVQPHFYADNTHEQERVTAVYANIRLHSVVESFAVAFRAYHVIARYAASIGARIVNATPGSMIDAFERVTL